MKITRLASECPECQKPLVRKKRKDGSGEFIGCSGWPRCRFIESLDVALQRIASELEDVTRDRDELLEMLRTGKDEPG